jgi:regulator of cell morphogenesis and NO signaling
MDITPTTHVADIVAAAPGTIAVFQKHEIEFCCGGHVPLGEVCAHEGLDVVQMMEELSAAQRPFQDTRNWEAASLGELIEHIQAEYHQPLYRELPRLSAMVNKVVQRHGDRLPETLPGLKTTFDALEPELVFHMRREDAVLFPAIVAFESHPPQVSGERSPLTDVIGVMERDHTRAQEALATFRALTGGYEPPANACPTFRGLYYGLAELEHRMRLHVHLENDILFPRALGLGGRRTGGPTQLDHTSP